MISVTDNHPVRPEDKDEFYHDILDGLSVYLGSSLILYILHAVREYPLLRLGHSLNESQVTCKKWLLDKLAESCGTEFGSIYILGGWYGVLGAMFLHDPGYNINKVVSVDLEPQCKPIADALNRIHVRNGKFQSVTGDVYLLDYDQLIQSTVNDAKPDLLINTSCEHIADIQSWMNKIPDQTLMAVQSNNYFDCEEHINCAPDLDAFNQQVPLSEVKYRGEMVLKKYTRFMLIGTK